MPKIQFIEDGRDATDDAAIRALQRVLETIPEDQRGKKKKEEGEVEEKHHAPTHPGTGTDQSVHDPTGGKGAGDGRTLYGGKVTPVKNEELASIGLQWNEGKAGENTWGYPRGKMLIKDPENPGYYAWLEGRDAILEYAENEIRGSETERGYYFANDGTVMEIVQGDAYSIKFEKSTVELVRRDAVLMEIVKRAIEAGEEVTFTHNHPVGENVPLSIQDIHVAMQYGVDEIRAVGRGGRISGIRFGDVPDSNDSRNYMIFIMSDIQDFNLTEAGYFKKLDQHRMSTGYAGTEPPEHLIPLYSEATRNAYIRGAEEFDWIEYFEEQR